MGNPLRTAVLSLLAPLAVALPAFAGEAVDKSSGTTISHSDEWRREPHVEQGSRKISLARPVEKGQFVRLIVEVGSADGFNADQWLEGENKSLGEQLTDVAKFQVDKSKLIGGLASTGYSTTAKIKDQDLRLRTYIVQRGPRVVVFREFSFNGAHEKLGDEAIEKLWSGISFGEAVAEVGDGTPQAGAEAGGMAAGEPIAIEDKLGNVKFTVPAGWSQMHPTPTDENQLIRGVFNRDDENGDRAMQVAVFRWEERNPAMFKRAPVEIVEMLVKRRVFSPYFGDDSEATLIRALRVDESKRLGSADVTCGFTVSSRTMKQMEAVREAQDKQRKGIKGVVVPEFEPTVVRGRVAILSPHIYLLYGQFRSDVASNEKLMAEWNKLVESFDLISSKPMPPALAVGRGSVGNTMEDPALQKEREEEIEHSQRGRQLHEIKFEIELPPGFKIVENSHQGQLIMVVVAQDAQNRWFKMTLQAVSKRAANETKGGNVQLDWSFDTELESWKSNWESKARGAKVPRKAQTVKIGNIKGKGYKELKGEVEGWPGTFMACVGDEEQWRCIIEVEMRGGFAKEYRKPVKKLLRSLRIKER
jgi:hypothetical protein